MSYKDELQASKEKKLNKLLIGVPKFITNYFKTFKSSVGKINSWYTIKDYISFITNGKKLEELQLEDIDVNYIDIISYLDDMENKVSNSSLKTKQKTLSSFYNYLVNMEYIKSNPVKKIEKSRYAIKNMNVAVKKAKMPTIDDIETIETNLKNEKNEFKNIRNNAIYELLKGSGMRLSEVVGIDIKDCYLDGEEPYIRILGKGCYRDIEAVNQRITKKAADAVAAWIIYRAKILDDGALFVTKCGKRYTYRGIQHMFDIYSNDTITPHMMRHLYSSVLYEKSGHDIVFVQEQVRHSSPDITANVYISAKSHNQLLNDL